MNQISLDWCRRQRKTSIWNKSEITRPHELPGILAAVVKCMGLRSVLAKRANMSPIESGPPFPNPFVQPEAVLQIDLAKRTKQLKGNIP